jgi:hypothetical protein
MTVSTVLLLSVCCIIGNSVDGGDMLYRQPKTFLYSRVRTPQTPEYVLPEYVLQASVLRGFVLRKFERGFTVDCTGPTVPERSTVDCTGSTVPVRSTVDCLYRPYSTGEEYCRQYRPYSTG